MPYSSSPSEKQHPQEQHAHTHSVQAAGIDLFVTHMRIEQMIRTFNTRERVKRNLEHVIFALGNDCYATPEEAQKAILPVYNEFMEIWCPRLTEDDIIQE